MNFIGQNMMQPPGGQNVGGPGPRGTGGPPVSRGGPGPGLFGPPTSRGGPPAVAIRLPPNLRTGLSFFNPGTVVHGQVTGQDKGGAYFLRLGEHTLQAESRVPLTVGQSVQFKVQGQNQGQVMLQLVKTPFTKMSTADLSQTLTALKMPASESNVALARTMVEHNIPLTKENFSFMQQVLAQPASPGANGQPPSMPARVAATHYLQSSGLPVNPQNVSVMANFLASNPQLGVQMFALNNEFRRLSRAGKGDGAAAVELMTGVQGALGEFILEPKRRTNASGKQSPSKRLMDMARQTGIETHLGVGGGSEDEWDLVAMLRELRGRCEREGKEDYGRLAALLKGVEENLEAHKLINQAKTESNLGYYYLQVPMRLEDGDVAEVWVRYHTEDDGTKVVDPEDTRIEFLVTTEHMGELYFTLELRQGVIHIDLGTPSEEVREFAARYLPALADRVSQLGWAPGRVGATYRPFTGRRRLVEHTDFEELERCNVQA